MMIKLISDGLVATLNEQLAHEKYNANLYLFIAGDLKNRGFNHLAAHFEGQHAEETEHSLIIYNLLTDLNASVELRAIDEVKLSINSVMDIARGYLEREVVTTKSLTEIKEQSIDEACPVVEERIRQMLILQQNEYAEATDWLDHAEICGNDWFKVFMWNLSLKE